VDIRQPVPLQYDSTKSVKTEISLATVFFNFLNFGLHGGADNDFEIKYESDGMTTINFTPTSDYIDKTIMQEAIQGYLQKHRTSLYMIVGVRVAHGAKFTYSQGRGRRGRADLGPFGLSAIGSPVDGRISITRSTSSSGGQTFTIDQDFVVAYRLRRCKYSRDSANLKPQFHTRGATMADLESSSSNTLQSRKKIGEDEKPTAEVISSLGIADVDMDAKTLKLNEECVRTAMDDEGCSCIVLSLTQRD